MVLYVARTFLLSKKQQATNHPTIIYKSSLFLRIKKRASIKRLSFYEKENFYYFTLSTIALNASGSFIARSASTFLFIEIPALCIAPINLE